MQPQTGQSVSSRFHQTAIGGVRRGNRSVGIRMTPMIDVIFLLLTFFVLTAKFQESEQILPIILGSTTPQIVQAVQTPLAVTIKPDAVGCRVHLENHAPIRLASGNPQEGLLMLSQMINEMPASDRRHRPIEIYCDDAVQWDFVVKIYDALYALGARDITFRVEE